MDYDTFKTACFVNGIDAQVIEGCRKFVFEHKSDLRPAHKMKRPINDDLGYAELASIITVEDSLKRIKTAITYSTVDYDTLGRSLETRNLKALRKDPGKHIKRLTLRAFYLIGGTV